MLWVKTLFAFGSLPGIHGLADMYMCGELESASRHFINENFLEVIHCEEFMQLSCDRLITLLKSDTIRVNKENEVMEAVCNWIQWDPDSRFSEACRLLPHVKLPLLEISYLENVVVQSEFVKNCAKCQLLISKAITTLHDSTSLQLIRPRAMPISIYVLGGRNSSDCQLSSMERYDFLRDQWSHVVSVYIYHLPLQYV